MFDTQKFNVLCDKKQFFKAFTFLRKNEDKLNVNSLKNILENHGERLVEIYFGQNSVSPKLTHFLLNAPNYKDQSIEIILKKKAFLQQEHFSFIKDLITDHTLLKELTFWRGTNSTIELELKQFDGYLRNLSLEKFFIRLVIYYEYNRFKNPSPLIDDPNILSVFNLILARYVKLKPKFGNPSPYHEVFFEKYKSELSQLQKNKGEFERLKKLFKSFEKLDIFNYVIDRYVYQGYNLDFLKNDRVSLKHPDRGYQKRWAINNVKIAVHHNYSHNLFGFIFEDHETRISNDPRLSEEKAEYYIRIERQYYQYERHFLLDKVITKKGFEFKARDFLKVMTALSVAGNKVWNEYMDKGSLIGKAISEKIEVLDEAVLKFMEISSEVAPPVFALHQRECVIDSQTRTNIKNKKDIRDILEWSSLDFHNIKSLKKIDLNWYPLIKFGDNYLFLCGIFSNKNYPDILASKIRFENLMKKEHSINLEKYVQFLFSEAQFTIYSENHRVGQGDFDLLAYKDKVLIVGQLKGTRSRATIKEIYDDKGAIKKAIEQIDKDRIEIENDFDHLKKELHIECSFEELTIYPIIITNNFEHEEELYPSNKFDFKISKISIVELEIALSNSKPILTKKEKDLFWENTDLTCSGKDFIKIFDKRLVWKDLINFNPKVNLVTEKFGDIIMEYRMCSF